jgi:hypothetical protein
VSLVKVDTIDTRLEDIVTLNAPLCAKGTIEVEKIVIAGPELLLPTLKFTDGSTMTSAATAVAVQAVARAYVSGSQYSNTDFTYYGSVTSWTDISTGLVKINLPSDAPDQDKICCTTGHSYYQAFVMCNQAWGTDGGNTAVWLYFYSGYAGGYRDATHFSAVFYW